MYLDQFGLPCQQNGDCSDQLQRVGMIAVGETLNLKGSIYPIIHLRSPLETLLQPSPGIYTRFTGAPTDDVTGDQLIPIFAYWTLIRNKRQLGAMIKAMIRRFGFAQNTRKDNDVVKTTPDFILFRTLPFITRYSRFLYLFSCILDIILVIASIIAVLQGSKENTDDNNIIITLAVCKAITPTPFSWVAAKLYVKLRPKPGAIGALRDYHAASTGGNPEIAELWVPIVKGF